VCASSHIKEVKLTMDLTSRAQNLDERYKISSKKWKKLALISLYDVFRLSGFETEVDTICVFPSSISSPITI
jgi:hypothetical protein